MEPMEPMRKISRFLNIGDPFKLNFFLRGQIISYSILQAYPDFHRTQEWRAENRARVAFPGLLEGVGEGGHNGSVCPRT